MASTITIETTIAASIETVWKCWTEPEHITKWNFASDDWCAPHAVNDLRTGGTFSFRMEAKDGSFGFDFGGVYDEIISHQKIAYTIGDGRKVTVNFSQLGNSCHVVEAFEAETVHPIEMQQAGWQAILHNFKKHVESLK